MGFWNRTKTTMDVAEDIDWPALVHLSWKGELLMELKSRGTQFTPEDLEEILAHVKKEYAITLLSSARVQSVDGYHRMMTTKLETVHANVRLSRSWKELTRFACVHSHEKSDLPNSSI
ncbi:MAG TPA: hypothetical protein O0Y05_02375 [Methanocorpusculum sp.]|nr:hypothetical protein [Methanocorpusculum sp.]